MERSPLYYFNIIHEDGRSNRKNQSAAAVWTEIQDSVESLGFVPGKMYNEGIFTFNNRLIIIPPNDVSKALDEIYKMPDGPTKKVLQRLAGLGTSLVPCEEQQLLAVWNKSEEDILRKEETGETISADEIGRQSVYLLTRNKVIGQVIAQTLAEDEAGILFLSVIHNPAGMMVNYLRDIQGLNVTEMNPHVR